MSKSTMDYVLKTRHPLPLLQDPAPETDESILQQRYVPTDMVFFDRGFSVLDNYGGFRLVSLIFQGRRLELGLVGHLVSLYYLLRWG